MSDRTLKILVELTIDSPSLAQVTSFEANSIKDGVENNLRGGTLPSYLHSLGTYHDAEVVSVVLTEAHDTRQ